MITLLAATLILAPVPAPPPPPYPTPSPVPNFLTQGDGTRIVCAPTGGYCWPGNDSLPSYMS